MLIRQRVSLTYTFARSVIISSRIALRASKASKGKLAQWMAVFCVSMVMTVEYETARQQRGQSLEFPSSQWEMQFMQYLIRWELAGIGGISVLVGLFTYSW